MRNLENQPHSGSAMWMMALVIITLGGKIDPYMADLIVMAITAYAMWRDSHTPTELK